MLLPWISVAAIRRKPVVATEISPALDGHGRRAVSVFLRLNHHCCFPPPTRCGQLHRNKTRIFFFFLYLRIALGRLWSPVGTFVDGQTRPTVMTPANVRTKYLNRTENSFWAHLSVSFSSQFPSTLKFPRLHHLCFTCSNNKNLFFFPDPIIPSSTHCFYLRFRKCFFIRNIYSYTTSVSNERGDSGKVTVSIVCGKRLGCITLIRKQNLVLNEIEIVLLYFRVIFFSLSDAVFGSLVREIV